jgi:hypothetical protein
MALKLNVGLSKKVGLPDYGSLGASCHVEVELDGSLLQQDLDSFHRQVRNAYAACSQAVNDELARQRSEEGNGAAASTGNDRPAQSTSAGQRSNGTSNGNGHRATQKQLDYLNQLARQVRGLGVRRLEALAEKLCGKPLAELTSLDASSLIDTVKAIKEGRVDLDAALSGAGA